MDISLDALNQDPYPIYEHWREQGGAPWVPALGMYVVPRHADVVAVARDLHTFSVIDGDSLSKQIMGTTMNRREGAEHMRERKAAEPPLKPRPVQDHWLARFQALADELIDNRIEQGRMDLVRDFSAPYAALCLRELLGLDGVEAEQMLQWSAALIAGSSNYEADPVVREAADTAAEEIGELVDRAIELKSAHPDDTVISSMVHSPHQVGVEAIRSNIRLFISGGLNEPRDVCATATYALLTSPAQRRRVAEDPSLFEVAFEESLRWTSPVGLLTRRTTAPATVGGTEIPSGSRVGLLLASANRDAEVFDRAADFDLTRGKTPHVAFNGGAHICLGAWAARAQVGRVALPTLFGRLQGLELAEPDEVAFRGWVFRALPSLAVRWER